MKKNKTLLLISRPSTFIFAAVTLFLSHMYLSAHVDQHSFVTHPRAEVLAMANDTFYIEGGFYEDFPLSGLITNSKYSSIFESLVDTSCWSSACDPFRNFIGEWEIIDNLLHLQNIRYCCGNDEISLQRVFDESMFDKNGIKASWVNDSFFVTDNLDIMSYLITLSNPPKYFTLIIENGTVVKFESYE